jgi:DNA replication protein
VYDYFSGQKFGKGTFMFEMRPIEDVIRVASAGGGFAMEARVKQTNDLVRIASAASKSGARVIFRGLDVRPVEDLIRIASAGKGTVIFE